MNKKTRVLIAEDHAIVRSGLHAMLNAEPDFEIVAEVGDGRTALRLVEKHQPALVLMDLSMPKMNGLQAIKEIKQRNPQTKVIVLTAHAAEEYVFAALEAGAEGYFLKDGTQDELMIAVRNVLAGQRYICPGVSQQVINGYIAGKAVLKPQTAWDTLTQREIEVLKLVAEGYKNREIADQLYISQKTVEKHRANLMKKLKLHNAADLVALALEKGLIVREPSLRD